MNRAVQEGGFAFCTAHDVRFGQYRRTVLQFALPVGRESGSTGGPFCNLYCLRCAIRAVQEGSFSICTARGVRLGQYREDFCILYCLRLMI